MQINDLDHRHTPIDTLIEGIEHDYRAGLIGITRDGEIMNLVDIYHDLKRCNPTTDYHIASPRGIDRETQKHCKREPTAYRTTELRETEQDRCPFCFGKQPT